MRKKFVKVLLLCLIATFTLFMVSCKKTNLQLEKVPEVVLSQDKLKLEIGQEFQLTAQCNGTEEELIWHSYDEGIVTVDNSGKIFAMQTGKTTVLGISGNYSGSCEVLVVEPIIETENLSIEFLDKNLTIDANDANNSIQLQATVYLNGIKVETEITYTSSDEEYVTVSNTGVATALKNGKIVQIKATATHNGVTVSSVCNISTEPFASIFCDDDQLNVYPNEQVQVEFEVMVDGNLFTNPQETTFYSLNAGVATVSDSGVIKGVAKGNTKIIIKYGSKEKAIDVRVGQITYVSDAHQFMQIEGAEEMHRFILTQNIDLSEYCKDNLLIDNEYIIENFDGELIGDGFTVSGFHRFSTANDEGFVGLFKQLGQKSLIKNVAFSGIVETKNANSLIALNAFGVIEECLFEFSNVTGLTTMGNNLFELNNGTVRNTVIKINYLNDSQENTLTVSPNGYGKYEQVSLIVKGGLTSSYISGAGSQINELFTDCVAYASEQDFVNENGYELNGNGKGEKKDFSSSLNYDQAVFEIKGEKVILLSIAQALEYSTFTVEDYQLLTLGQKVAIKNPVSSDTFDYGVKILNQRCEDVTKDTVINGEFSPNKTGRYYIVHYGHKNSLNSFVLKEILVVQDKPNINYTQTTLKVGNTHQIVVDGKQNDQFVFMSSNDSVASVNASGLITATGVGNANIKGYSTETSLGYNVYVSVVADYDTISNAQEFVEKMTSATTGKILVLTQDITIPKEMVKTSQASADSAVLAFVVDSFYGILDAQGYKISLEMEIENAAVNGLIKQVCRKAEIRNLNYQADITYKPYDKLAYIGTFCTTFSGYMENCYLKTNLYPTAEPQDQESLIAVAKCEDGFSGTSSIRNCVFEINTEYNGKKIDNGYAIRMGTSPVISAYDCVLIKNGLKADFFSGPKNASAVQCTNCLTYKTVYDFVNAKDGQIFFTQRISKKAVDGAHVYAEWPSVWQIDKESIYLCGRKVTDVSFVPHEQSKSLSISENGGKLTWVSVGGEYEIYINDTYVTETSDNTFDVQKYITETYGLEQAEYRVFVKGDGIAGVNVYQVIHLNQSNFVTTLREMNTSKNAENKLFILSEDVNVSWNDFYNFGGKDGMRLFDDLYANVDGQGRCVRVNVDTTSSGFKGLIDSEYGTWQNTYFNITAKYVVDDSEGRSVLIDEYYSGAFINNYVLINLTPVNSSGASAIDNSVAVIGSAYGGIEYRNNILNLNSFDKEQKTVIYVFGTYSSLGPVMNNFAIVRNNKQIQLNKGYKVEDANLTCEKKIVNTGLYESVANFLKGDGYIITRDIDGANKDLDNVKGETAEYGDKNIIYGNWDNVWEITDNSISLCGRLLVKVVNVGDDSISDGNVNDLQSEG